MTTIECKVGESVLLPETDVRLTLVEANSGWARLQMEKDAAECSRSGSAVRHRLRNQLNSLAMQLYLSRRLRQAGMAADAENALNRAIEELHRIAEETCGEISSDH